MPDAMVHDRQIGCLAKRRFPCGQRDRSVSISNEKRIFQLSVGLAKQRKSRRGFPRYDSKKAVRDSLLHDFVAKTNWFLVHRASASPGTFALPRPRLIERGVLAQFRSQASPGKVIRALERGRRLGSHDALKVIARVLNSMEARRRAEVGQRSPLTAFINRVQQLDRRGHTDSALDLLYDSVDELMRRQEFGHLDSLLARLEPSQFSVDILLGLLTATLPAKSRIPARATLFEKSEKTLTQRGENDVGLLTGLEG